MQALLILGLGLAVGALSGIMGIGGGVLLIPGLMYLMGFSQHTAQGTTLAAMVPPIGLFAAIQYWRQDYVDPWAALYIAIGFAAGSFITAGFIKHINHAVLSQLFGMLLLFLGVKMILQSNRAAHVFLGAVVSWVLAWSLFILFRHFGNKYNVRPYFKATLKSAAAASPPDSDYQI